MTEQSHAILLDQMEQMVEEVSRAREQGHQPRVHGNGFVQLDLTPRRRLHVWGDPRIPRQAIPSQIHDHTFSFTSTVMSGQLVHRWLMVQPDMRGGYRLYQAVVNHGENTRLVEQPQRWAATIMEERLLRAGDVYSFEAGLFHETVAPWPCVTVIEKDGPTLSQGGPSPRVLVPADCEPDNTFNRYATPAELLWAIIDDALHLTQLRAALRPQEETKGTTDEDQAQASTVVAMAHHDSPGDVADRLAHAELAPAASSGDAAALDRAEVVALRDALAQVAREIADAMAVLAPNMPESGLVDACRQVKQVAISEADNSKQLEAALAARQGAQTWQPIETAPKDGTRVDLWAKCWISAFDRFESRRFADCWWMKDGEFGSRAHWVDLDANWCPTHWMPLPAAPARAQE